MDVFQFCLRNFCSYCPDFDPAIEKVDCTLIGDSSQKTMNNIRCQNESRCNNIAENLKGKV
ncbi:hypothetical protein [Lacrimispora sp.]|uniref:hypothetical protein n=1 Tax=Lacrimispora sp. TaxID=2719234 RepID=UPI0028A5A7F5|nr:hypothetical protein [Lacrimispora sp.]